MLDLKQLVDKHCSRILSKATLHVSGGLLVLGSFGPQASAAKPAVNNNQAASTELITAPRETSLRVAVDSTFINKPRDWPEVEALRIALWKLSFSSFDERNSTLERFAQDPQPEVRAVAVTALNNVRDWPRARCLIEAATHDSSDIVREQATKMLKPEMPVESERLLQLVSHDRTVSVQVAALRRFAFMSVEGDPDLFLSILSDTSKALRVRMTAARALGTHKIWSEKRSRATIALLSEAIAPFMANQQPKWYRAPSGFIGLDELQPDFMSTIGNLNGCSPSVADFLGRYGIDLRLPAEVRKEMLFALRESHEPSSIVALTKGVADSTELVRIDSARALGLLPNFKGKSALSTLIFSDDLGTSSAACWGLWPVLENGGSLSTKELSRIIHLASNTPVRLRQWVMPVLEKYLSDHPDEQLQAFIERYSEGLPGRPHIRRSK